MPTATTPAKRPRIDAQLLDEITSMHPDKPFERAVNDTIRETWDARNMLAETILGIEGDRGGLKDFMARRDELALKMDTRSLIRVLRLRLHDRGVEV